MGLDDKDTRYYSKRHLWARCDEKTHVAYVGITEYLADLISEIVSVDMPEIGDEIDSDQMFVHLHLVNRIHHLRSPLTGRIQEVNQDVMDNPSLLHLDPNKYWLLTMEYDLEEELDMLMDVRDYSDYVDKR